MSWRVVVISKRAKLDYQLGYLVVRNESVTKIHLGEISTLLIEFYGSFHIYKSSCRTDKEENQGDIL